MNEELEQIFGRKVDFIFKVYYFYTFSIILRVKETAIIAIARCFEQWNQY